jgi:hypothetical protein
MPTTAQMRNKAAQSQELMQMLLNLSLEEVANLQRLLHQVQRLKSSAPKQNRKTQRQQRFIDPQDNAPVWDLGFVDEFDRATCYENTSDEP